MSLFSDLGNSTNDMNNLFGQFQQFARNFKGDPQQQIQQLLNSGQINNNMLNQAMQKAKAFQQMFNLFK